MFGILVPSTLCIECTEGFYKPTHTEKAANVPIERLYLGLRKKGFLNPRIEKAANAPIERLLFGIEEKRVLNPRRKGGKCRNRKTLFSVMRKRVFKPSAVNTAFKRFHL